MDLIMKEAGVEGQTDRHREAKREQNWDSRVIRKWVAEGGNLLSLREFRVGVGVRRVKKLVAGTLKCATGTCNTEETWRLACTEKLIGTTDSHLSLLRLGIWETEFPLDLTCQPFVGGKMQCNHFCNCFLTEIRASLSGPRKVEWWSKPGIRESRKC